MAINSFFEINSQIKSINTEIQVAEKKLTFAMYNRIFGFELSELDQSRSDFPAIDQVEDWYIKTITPAIMPHEYI